MTHPQIAAFARVAKENEPPVRTIEGHNTLLSRTMHGFSFDAIHDEIVVNSPLAQAILTFRGAADGEEPPIRVIQGPKTRIVGVGRQALSRVTADPAHNEIFLPIGSGSNFNEPELQGPHPLGVLVFDREANGDVAPKRFLTGPATQIVTPDPPVEIDPLRDLLIVSSNGKLLIFDRTADGNTPPLRTIGGPMNPAGGGQMAIYPEKGYIIAGAGRGSRGVWSVLDEGDVPPRWRIPVADILGAGPNGIALVPEHKELLVSSGNLNRIVTFYFPEMFE